MRRIARGLVVFAGLGAGGVNVRADMIAAPPGRPAAPLTGTSPAVEMLGKLDPADRVYFAENPARIRTARGLFDLRPQDDGISAWAPPVEIGLAFVVGAASIVKFVFADLPASITVDSTK